MQYSNLKPLRQESFGINVTKPEDIVISGKDTIQGILYFQSGMPTFRQTQAPCLVSREKTYHKNGASYCVRTDTRHFCGDYIDDYKDTVPYCPCCNCQLVGNGTITNELRHLPIGDTYTTLDVSRRRLRCPNLSCSYHYDCPIDFKAPDHLITIQLLSFTQDLLAMHMPLKTVARLTGLNKNTVKEIDLERLKSLYTVNGEGKKLKLPKERAEFLAIDEFKLHDGHKYATVIIDLESGHILHIAHGRKKATVYEFIDRVGLEWMSSVKAVACDMNSDFEEAFTEKCPHLKIVYDYFHIRKNFSDKVIAEVRKDEQIRLKAEGRDEEARALKKTKYILTSNVETLIQKDTDADEGKLVSKGSELFNQPERKAKGGLKKKYDKLISENELFLALDIVKEKLEVAYKQTNEDEMRKHISEIIEICHGTGNKHFEWFSKLLSGHINGIVNHARYKISTSKLEGFNNAIKTERRQGYGYPDDEYFFLRLIDRSYMKKNYS